MKRFATAILLLGTLLPAFPLTLTVSPGELTAALTTIDAGATSLNLMGKIDARDLQALQSLPASIKVLNLANTEVVAYNGVLQAFAPQTIFPAGFLPEHLFFGTTLTEIYLPPNITAMGNAICANSPTLTTAGVGNGSTLLSDYAFYNCPQLASVYLPSSLVSIGRYAVANCPALPVISLSGTAVTDFPEGIFSGDSSLAMVQLPQGLASIGPEAFAGTAIRTLDLPGVDTYASFALAGMPMLESVTLNPVASFGRGLLMNDHALTDIQGIPSDVPDLFAANATSANGEEIASLASSLGKYALSHLSIDSIALSPDLDYIDKGALAHVQGLQLLNATALGTNIPSVHPQAFTRLRPSDVMLKVTPESEDLWKQDPVWGQFRVVSSTTSVSETAAQSDVEISIRSGLLTVVAPSEIAAVYVWNADGTASGAWKPASDRFETRLNASTPGSVVMVKALLASGQTHTKAIMTR